MVAAAAAANVKVDDESAADRHRTAVFHNGHAGGEGGKTHAQVMTSARRLVMDCVLYAVPFFLFVSSLTTTTVNIQSDQYTHTQTKKRKKKDSIGDDDFYFFFYMVVRDISSSSSHPLTLLAPFVTTTHTHTHKKITKNKLKIFLKNKSQVKEEDENHFSLTDNRSVGRSVVQFPFINKILTAKSSSIAAT
jgi:hypothetical protein